MGNLFGIGLSGLSAAQSGLTTTSNNISNVNTPGYTRRKVLLGQAPVSQQQGTGVLVNGIQRQYQRFLSTQVRNADSRASALQSHLTQMSRVNNLLGDSEAGLAPLMQDFFASMQALSGNPEGSAAREALLGDAQNMAAQFRTFSSYLADMDTSVEEQLRSAVKQINNYGKQIYNLNEQISLTRARTGNPPNKLLDERNQLVSELSKLVDVDVTIQDGDKYILTVAGRPLVDAAGARSFTMVPSSMDTSKRVVAYRAVDGTLHEMDPGSFTGGSVGGLINFRNESLVPTELRLNQLAHSMAAEVNRVHASGYDLDGETGNVFFTAANDGAYTPEQTVTFADSGNTSGVTVGSINISSPAAADQSNYRVEYQGINPITTQGEYRVVRLSDGQVSTVTDANNDGTFSWPSSANSFTLALSAVPDEGDSFVVRTSGSFSASQPVVYSNDVNAGTAELSAHFNGNPSDVVPSNYRVEWDATASNYQVTRLSDGAVTTHTATITAPATKPEFSIGGFTVTVESGVPQDGDTFLVKPLENAAANMNVAISDAADIAAANPDPDNVGTSNGAGDNGNMLELFNLQNNQTTVGGGSSFNGAYAQLVADVGNTTSVLQVNSTAQDSVTTELRKAEQSVSGVNLSEERVNLLYYTKLYRANAKIIQTATTVFDTILRIG